MAGTVPISLARLPGFLVLDPVSTARIEIERKSPSCEIEVELQNPRPGRSFVLLIGQRGGPYLERMRLSSRARILFKPKSVGEDLLLLANPNREPLILRLRGHNIRARRRPRARPRARGSSATRQQRPNAARAPSTRSRSLRVAEGPAPRLGSPGSRSDVRAKN
ncbi:MAG: hypothetical protein ACLQD9_01675 [Thermoplasmata archaeon]